MRVRVIATVLCAAGATVPALAGEDAVTRWNVGAWTVWRPLASRASRAESPARSPV